MTPKPINDYNKNKNRLLMDEDLSLEDQEYLEKLPKQNPYGEISLIAGGISFMFGPDIWYLPVITAVFTIVSYKKFDKNKEDNPWPFYIGITLSLIGLYMFIMGEHHIVL